MEVDLIDSLISYTSNDSTIDANSLPASKTHVMFWGNEYPFEHREIFERLVTFGWDHMKGIIEHGTSDVGNLMGPAVDGRVWNWSMLPDKRLSKIVGCFNPIIEKIISNSPNLTLIPQVANNLLMEILGHCQRMSLNGLEGSSIDKINSTFDKIFDVLVSKDIDMCLLGVFCGLPFGEYGIMFSVATVVQGIWGLLRPYKMSISHKGKMSTYIRKAEQLNGNHSVDSLRQITSTLLSLAPTPKSFLSAALFHLWLQSTTATNANLENINGLATFDRFREIGSCVYEYLKCPQDMNTLAQLLEQPNILFIDRDSEKLSNIVSIIQTTIPNSFDLIKNLIQ